VSTTTEERRIIVSRVRIIIGQAGQQEFGGKI
jgi:hypothetical protein